MGCPGNGLRLSGGQDWMIGCTRVFTPWNKHSAGADEYFSNSFVWIPHWIGLLLHQQFRFNKIKIFVFSSYMFIGTDFSNNGHKFEKGHLAIASLSQRIEIDQNIVHFEDRLRCDLGQVSSVRLSKPISCQFLLLIEEILSTYSSL